MQLSIYRAIAALTIGDDAERHFDLAAQRIQHALLDIKIPRVPGIEIGVHAEPARLVGGDYIDLFSATAGAPFVFGLGDASGKSLAAALNALMLRYLVRGLIEALGTDDLARIVAHCNRVIADDLEAEQFITFLLGTFEGARGMLRVVNAGHEPPLILRAGAQTPEVMEAGGMVLGIERAAEYTAHSCTLGPGDIVLIYTDGLTEASNERGELYTIERLCENLVAERALPAQYLADTIFQNVKNYAGGPLRDDATVLALRVSA